MAPGAADLSGPNATVKSLTIEGCTFNQRKNSDQAVPALNIGTNVKNESDKPNITGAYEVTIEENLTDMLIKLPYLDKESAQSVTVAAGATAHKDANGSFETVTAVVDAAKAGGFRFHRGHDGSGELFGHQPQECAGKRE